MSDLGHHQECPPAPQLLGLENVAKDVVTHVQHVVALGTDQVTEDVAGPARVDLPLLEWAHVAAYPQSTGVLAQNGIIDK